MLMTHMPAQFRMPAVLVKEWRRRAAEYRPTNVEAADVYERCANELEELDVHTEGTPGEPGRLRRMRAEMIVPGLVVLGLIAAAVTGARRPILRAVGEPNDRGARTRPVI